MIQRCFSIGMAWLVSVACLATASSCLAGEIEGIEFADEIESPEGKLVLRGLGLLRYRIIFRGYVAGLYLPPGVPSSAVLDDVPKQLELEYFWSIPGSAFGPAGEEVLARSQDVDALAKLRERLDRIAAAYVDVEPGDRYALRYEPGAGTLLSKNGEALVRIPGADFAAAYFSIWLGSDPINYALRDKLLSEP